MTDLKPPTIGSSIIELCKYPEQPHRSGVSLYQMPKLNAQDINLDVHLTLPLAVSTFDTPPCRPPHHYHYHQPSAFPPTPGRTHRPTKPFPPAHSDLYMLDSVSDSIKMIQWLIHVISSTAVSHISTFLSGPANGKKKKDQKTLICPCHHATWQPSHHSGQTRSHSGTRTHVGSETSRPCTPSGTTVVPGKCIIDKHIAHQMGISDRPVLFYEVSVHVNVLRGFLHSSSEIHFISAVKEVCMFAQLLIVNSC